MGGNAVFGRNTRADFGPDSLLGRESDREVVLNRIKELNPGLSTTVYDDSARQIEWMRQTQMAVSADQEALQCRLRGFSRERQYLD